MEGKKAKVLATNPFMKEAIAEAFKGIRNGHGGPFGCVIVKDGLIVGKGHNKVLKNNDSTAHGEIVAIRSAERRLKTFDLSGCEIYTTGEPCPMCLYAILWAKIEKVYFGCTISDNATIGFRDEELEILNGNRKALGIDMECIDRASCLELFEIYKATEHRLY